ncbi:MAG: hypothetical protein JNN00_04475, partial [Chitinophagaceae bacterium]|nr:hypothetical protein [Chitinophagaceae bacterium]
NDGDPGRRRRLQAPGVFVIAGLAIIIMDNNGQTRQAETIFILVREDTHHVNRMYENMHHGGENSSREFCAEQKSVAS